MVFGVFSKPTNAFLIQSYDSEHSEPLTASGQNGSPYVIQFSWSRVLYKNPANLRR